MPLSATSVVSLKTPRSLTLVSLHHQTPIPPIKYHGIFCHIMIQSQCVARCAIVWYKPQSAMGRSWARAAFWLTHLYNRLFEEQCVANEEQQFDVVVIGAGPGGYVAAIRAAQLGAKVAIVEKEYIGGTCLNVGCIPSKALIHIADTLRNFDLYEDFGIHVEKPKFDMRQAVTFKEKVVKQLTGGVGQLLKANNIKVFDGLGTPLSANRVRIEGKDGKQEVTASKLILANGSVTLKPPFPGINGERVIFSDDVLSLKEAPRSMICIGGGVIAVELACAFAAFGTKVTVIEMLQ